MNARKIKGRAREREIGSVVVFMGVCALKESVVTHVVEYCGILRLQRGKKVIIFFKLAN